MDCRHCQNWLFINTVQMYGFNNTVKIDGLLTPSITLSPPPPPPPHTHHPSHELYAGNLPGLTHSSFLEAQSESNITLTGSFLMQDHFGVNIVAWGMCSLPRIMILAIPSPELLRRLVSIKVVWQASSFCLECGRHCHQKYFAVLMNPVMTH